MVCLHFAFNFCYTRFKSKEVRIFLLKRRKARRSHREASSWLAAGIVLGSMLLSFWTLASAKDHLKPHANSSTMLFVSRISHSAQVVAQRNKLYASVMMAQAILESANGQSKLSQEPYYNFLGIKGSYKGKSVILPTLEDDGQGNLYQIDTPFRSYGSLTACFEDYARVLSDPLYRHSHRGIHTSYQQATASLTGTYATDTSYGEKLNRIIEDYQLTYFDAPIR